MEADTALGRKEDISLTVISSRSGMVLDGTICIIGNGRNKFEGLA